MNERKQAIDLLRRARDILAERLTDRVLQAKDDILEDVLGLATSSEVDAIYEQLGIRLAHLNQLLANLPPDGNAGESASAASAPDCQNATDVELTLGDEPDRIPSVDLPGLHAAADVPPPHSRFPSPDETLKLSGPPTVASFRLLARRVVSADLEGASQILAELFELELPRARQCIEVFGDDVAENPRQVGRLTQLRRDVEAGLHTEALILLHDCFGLSGLESVSVLQSLRAQLLK